MIRGASLGGRENVATRIYEKEMGITHGEFFRLLAFALGTDQYSRGTNSASLQNVDKSVEIKLGPEGIRQIALLVVPTTPVELTLGGFSDAEAEKFMVKFDRAYQRGGG